MNCQTKQFPSMTATRLRSQLLALSHVLAWESAANKGFYVEPVHDRLAEFAACVDTPPAIHSPLSGDLQKLRDGDPNVGLFAVNSERDGVGYVAGYTFVVAENGMICRAYAITYT